MHDVPVVQKEPPQGTAPRGAQTLLMQEPLQQLPLLPVPQKACPTSQQVPVLPSATCGKAMRSVGVCMNALLP